MTTIALQTRGKTSQCRNHIKTFCTTRRPSTQLCDWIIIENEHGFVKLFRELARDEAKNAFVPAVPADQYNHVRRLPLRLFPHVTHQFFGFLLTLDVQCYQLSSVGSSLIFTIGGEELESNTGMFHASCCIDAWAESEGDVTFADFAEL